MQPTYPSINHFVRLKYSFIHVLDSAGCDDLNTLEFYTLQAIPIFMRKTNLKSHKSN